MTERPNATWVIVVTVFVALVLTIVPLPQSLEGFRPAWIALTVIYWSMALPQRVSVGVSWTLGLLLDVMMGTLLGQHAMAMTLLTLVTQKFHLQIRVFPWHQQMFIVGLLLGVYEFALFWVDGISGEGKPKQLYVTALIAGALLWPWTLALLRVLRRQYHVT